MRYFHKLTPDDTFIFHFRHDLAPPGAQTPPSTRRAVTVAIVFFGETIYTGVAPCSWQDQFTRKIGYRIALGRALLSSATNGVSYIPPDDRPRVEWARDHAEIIDRSYDK